MQGPGHRPALRPAAACLLLAWLCGCASSSLDIIQVGPWFAPRRPSEVEVFSSRGEMRGVWGGIAIIHGAHVPAASAETIENQKRQARAAAAKIGADGVIISIASVDPGPMTGNYQEPEVYLSALAIKYAATASTPIAK